MIVKCSLFLDCKAKYELEHVRHASADVVSIHCDPDCACPFGRPRSIQRINLFGWELLEFVED
jgi:hypothetical protein